MRPWFLCTLLAVLTITGFSLEAASTVQFTTTSYSVAENDGSVTVTVQRLEDLNTVVSVEYASADITSTTVAATGGLVDWRAGPSTLVTAFAIIDLLEL